MANPRLVYLRHPDDHGVDEIFFVDRVPNTVDEADAGAFLRIALVERYKTSYLSGDEWRFSTGLYVREHQRKDWRKISVAGSIDSHCAKLYAELFGDFKAGKWDREFFDRKVGAVTFQWKGTPVYSASYDGEATTVLVAAGHLPWARMLASDEGMDTSALQLLCCQPGCREEYVSVYAPKHRYCSSGHEMEASLGGSTAVRAFCRNHLRRGDCALEDADRNYEVLSGPGPDGNEPDPHVVKEAGRVNL